MSEKGNIPLANLVSILSSLSTDIYLITGDAGYALYRDIKKIHTHGIKHKTRANLLMRIISYISTQLRISYKLLKIISKVDICIFFIGGEGLLLPMLVARLFRAKVVLALAGFPAKGSQIQRDPLAKVTGFLSKLNLILSSRIATYSQRAIEQRGLEEYKGKISVAHEYFLDFDKFAIKKQATERGKIIGYIGSLSKIKGVPNLLQAIPKVLEEENDAKFLIAGAGDLFNSIGEFINKNELTNKVELLGWIPHQELPEYLNELKLLILPSYTEGLSFITREAMACGTPVLATPVGGIPDVIKDGETGFILEDNSPECIARNIIRAIHYPELDKITRNANAYVKQEYTYEAAVERYGNILASLK